MTRIAPATEALQRIISRVEPLLPAVAVGIAASYSEEFEEYARLADDERERVAESSLDNLNALMREVLNDALDEVGFDELSYERAGADRMRMGISIDALMRSFTVWGQRVWAFVRESAEPRTEEELRALLVIGERILWHAQKATSSMARGYMREASATWTDRELTRHAMLEALLTGRVDSEEVSRARVAREIAEDYIAIVGVLRGSSETRGPTPRFIERAHHALARAGTPTRPLVGIRDAAVFILWPVSNVPHPPAVEALQQAFPELAFGVGRPSGDLAAVATSYSEASAAARIARALGETGGVEHFDVGLELALVDQPALRRLADEVLAPLQDYDRRRNAALGETLRAYIDAGGNVIEAARHTYVHANTVAYRLRRVADISGYDPREARGLLALSLSLLVQRLGGDGPSE